MKKRIIVLSMALGYACTTTHAHTLTYEKNSSSTSNSSKEKVKIGVGGGSSIARLNNVTINNNTTKLPRFGFHVQAFGAYPLNEYLDISLAIGYQAKGNRLNFTIPIGNFRLEKRRHFDYLQTTTQLNIFLGKERHGLLKK